MRRIPLYLRLAPAVLSSLCFAVPASADTVHRFFKRDGFWHHGSGWIFPTRVAGLALERDPSQIDGNEDVTADYSSDSNGSDSNGSDSHGTDSSGADSHGVHRAAVLDIYYPTSAAVGAKLITAKADVQGRAEQGGCKTSAAEAKFAIEGHPELGGVKITFTPEKAEGCSQAALYFFQTADWIVSIRASAAANDEGASKVFDSFVREQLWDTLGTDPMLHEPPT